MKEYTRKCLRTWNVKISKKERISNATLGIIGEIYECIESEFHQDEIGDVYYYCAVLLYELKFPDSKFGLLLTAHPTNKFEIVYSNTFLLVQAAKLAELVKKYTFHGRKDTLEFIELHLGKILSFLVWKNGLELVESTLKRNIEKLEERYPFAI